jgi:hypothetical protein
VRRVQQRRRVGLAVAVTVVVFVAGVPACFDFTPTPYDGPRASCGDCTQDWQTCAVEVPDGNWLGCAHEYCFGGNWRMGDQCPSGWTELGFWGPSCRPECTVSLPCSGAGWNGLQCCNPECPPDAGHGDAEVYVPGEPATSDSGGSSGEAGGDAAADGGASPGDAVLDVSMGVLVDAANE